MWYFTIARALKSNSFLKEHKIFFTLKNFTSNGLRRAILKNESHMFLQTPQTNRKRKKWKFQEVFNNFYIFIPHNKGKEET